MQKINVLIADDSAVIRAMLQQQLKSEDGFEVIDAVSNGKRALVVAEEKKPDLIICDVDMPVLNGIEFCRQFCNHSSIPVIIFSENEAYEKEALSVGAEYFQLKPNLSSYKKEFFIPFLEKIRCIAEKYITGNKKLHVNETEIKSHSDIKVLCIGASTGGPTAVQTVLTGLGNNFPLPILYVQHIEVGDDKKMAAWFKKTCPNLQFELAKNGQEAKPGTVYMSPAEVHLLVDYINENGNPVLLLSTEEKEHFLRPAVNKLFRSAAEKYKSSVLAVLMTGMGRDGAEGCKKIIDAGGYTIAEDKSTCAVFGMPAAAIELNAASEILPRTQIASRILTILQ